MASRMKKGKRKRRDGRDCRQKPRDQLVARASLSGVPTLRAPRVSDSHHEQQLLSLIRSLKTK